MKDLVSKIANFSIEDFAVVIPRNGAMSQYRDCVIQFGMTDEDDNPIDDGFFHVVCSSWDILPKTLRDEKFKTAGEVFTKFLVDGKPLGELAEDLEINPPPVDG